MRIFKTLFLTLVVSLATLGTASAVPIPDECKVGGVAIGVQAYSFKNYSVLEGIERAAKTGAKVIEFYEGQRFSPDDKSRFGHDSPPEHITRVKEVLKKHGIRAVNYGVVNIPNDEAKARKIFEFAKTMELYALTTESVNAIGVIEKLVKEYDVRVGFHNHPRIPRNPNYKVWDAKFILELVNDRDPRIGATPDIGHWTTDKLDVVANLKLLEGRIISVHAKDRHAVGHPVKNVPLGKGVINIGAVLDELKRQKFSGNISIEYEDKWADNVPEITESITFVREYAAKKAK